MQNAPRIFLIAAIAIVAYLLIQAWDKDYGHQSTSIATQISQENQGINTDSITASETPTAEAAAPTPSTEEVPQGDAPAPAPVSKGSRVHVKTQDLELWISQTGGDIRALDLLDYPISIEEGASPIPLLSESSRLFYIAQSGLIGADGPDASERPLYEVEQSEYLVDSGTQDVVLTWRSDLLEVKKIYSVPAQGHAIGLRYEVRNLGADAASVQMYTQLARDDSGDISSSNAVGSYSYLGSSFSTNEDPYQKIDFDEFDEGFKKSQKGGWMAFQQHYFLSAWIPNQHDAGTFSTRRLNNKNYASWVGSLHQIEAGETKTLSSTFYAGPKIQKDLEALAPSLELTIDYGILWFIGKPIFTTMTWIQNYVPNWGWTIVILTLIIKILLYPLSAASYRSMAKMRAVGPEMQRMRERFGDDRQKLSQAMMEFYKKEKINPLGGCLPILLQMPVFISLYWVLLESVEIRQADFLWIQDLSQMDPFYVLPLLMGASMFIQQTLNPTPPDPMQAKIMKFLPVIFTIFFLWFPAGLVLYWLVNNILSIAQQWHITRKIEQASKTAKS